MAKASTLAPEQTLEEAAYLRSLIDSQTPVAVTLLDKRIVRGIIEYYDVHFFRLTRNGQPNLFIYKDQVKYVAEEATA